MMLQWGGAVIQYRTGSLTALRIDIHSVCPPELLSPSLGEVPVLPGPGPMGLYGTVQVVLGFAHCLARIAFPCPLSTSCLLSVSKNLLLLVLYSLLSLGFIL